MSLLLVHQVEILHVTVSHLQEGGTETPGTSRVERSFSQAVPGQKEKVLMEHPESRHCVPASLTAVSGYHSEVHSLSA